MNFKETFNNYKQLIPIIFLAFYCIDTISTAINGTVVILYKTEEFELAIQHYLAFGAVVINMYLFFFHKAFYKYGLILTILLGLFNILTFSPLRETFSLKGLPIGFQPSALLAGLLAYGINFDRATKFILRTVRTNYTPEQIVKIEQKKFAEETQKFVSRYKAYSTESLHQIVRENEFVPAAIEAAKQLILTREKKS